MRGRGGPSDGEDRRTGRRGEAGTQLCRMVGSSVCRVGGTGDRVWGEGALPARPDSADFSLSPFPKHPTPSTVTPFSLFRQWVLKCQRAGKFRVNVTLWDEH